VAAVEATLPDELRRGHLSVDGETSLGGITLHSVEQLEQLAPFGEGNRRPLFCASGVTLAEPAKAMGATRQHIQMRLRHHAAQIRGVAFGGAEWLPHLPPPGQPFHIAFRPTINAYGGRRMPEIHVVDWRPDGIDVARDLPASAAATA
jgi:single-stranded-DNA-specific exonuclease